MGIISKSSIIANVKFIYRGSLLTNPTFVLHKIFEFFRRAYSVSQVLFHQSKCTLDCTLKCTYNPDMNYISTTELRKKSSTLRDSLKRGENTYILHRSKVIGVVEPYEESNKTFSLKQLSKLHKAIPPSKVQYTHREREKIYAKHLRKKYGQSVS